jgi:hypothetical protein
MNIQKQKNFQRIYRRFKNRQNNIQQLFLSRNFKIWQKRMGEALNLMLAKIYPNFLMQNTLQGDLLGNRKQRKEARKMLIVLLMRDNTVYVKTCPYQKIWTLEIKTSGTAFSLR